MRYKRLKQVNFMRLLNTQMQFKQKTYIKGQTITMAERKKTEVQTMIYKTLHRKQKILQHEPTQKMGVGGGGTHVPQKGVQFLLHKWHPSCYSC